MDSSVIICGYTEDRYSDILDAVDSLRRQKDGDPEVLLVVDRNEKLFHRLEKENIADKLLFSKEPGLSAGRNVGIKQAQGHFVAFLDDDAVAHSEWIQVLREQYDDKTIFGAGGKIIPHWLDSSREWYPPAVYWVIGCTYSGFPERRMFVRNTFGSNISFRRDLLQKSVFDADFGRVDEIMATGEETDLCIQLKRANPQMNFVYDPRAIVEHKIFPERTTLGFAARRGYGEGFSKRKLKRKYSDDKGTLSSESSYLTDSVIPMFKEVELSGTYMKRALYVSTVVLSFAAGYALSSGR